MVTPAMRASRTSLPAVIIEKAVSTQVFVPPFLKRWPLAEEITTGLARLGVIIVGVWAEARTRATRLAAVPVNTNSRRLILRAIGISRIDSSGWGSRNCDRLLSESHRAQPSRRVVYWIY
jgi:hypothetical protein